MPSRGLASVHPRIQPSCSNGKFALARTELAYVDILPISRAAGLSTLAKKTTVCPANNISMCECRSSVPPGCACDLPEASKDMQLVDIDGIAVVRRK